MEQAYHISRAHNYLTRLAEEGLQSRYLNRECRFWVRIVYPSKGIRKIPMFAAVVLEISEVGASISGKFPPDLDNFYIVLGDFEVAIAASVTKRNDTYLEVSFNKAQSTRLVDRLARVDVPSSTLHNLQSVLRAGDEQRLVDRSQEAGSDRDKQATPG